MSPFIMSWLWLGVAQAACEGALFPPEDLPVGPTPAVLIEVRDADGDYVFVGEGGDEVPAVGASAWTTYPPGSPGLRPPITRALLTPETPLSPGVHQLVGPHGALGRWQVSAQPDDTAPTWTSSPQAEASRVSLSYSEPAFVLVAPVADLSGMYSWPMLLSDGALELSGPDCSGADLFKGHPAMGDTGGAFELVPVDAAGQMGETRRARVSGWPASGALRTPEGDGLAPALRATRFDGDEGQRVCWEASGLLPESLRVTGADARLMERGCVTSRRRRPKLVVSYPDGERVKLAPERLDGWPAAPLPIWGASGGRAQVFGPDAQGQLYVTSSDRYAGAQTSRVAPSGLQPVRDGVGFLGSLAGVAVDRDGQTWAIAGCELVTLDADGAVSRRWPEEDFGGCLRFVGAAQDGGVWVSTEEALSRVTGEGVVERLALPDTRSALDDPRGLLVATGREVHLRAPGASELSPLAEGLSSRARVVGVAWTAEGPLALTTSALLDWDDADGAWVRRAEVLEGRALDLAVLEAPATPVEDVSVEAVYVLTTGALLRLEGEAFAPVLAEGSVPARLYGLHAADGALFVSTQELGALRVSPDGAVAWLGSSAPASLAEDLRAVAPAADGGLWLRTGAGVHHLDPELRRLTPHFGPPLPEHEALYHPPQAKPVGPEGGAWTLTRGALSDPNGAQVETPFQPRGFCVDAQGRLVIHDDKRAARQGAGGWEALLARPLEDKLQTFRVHSGPDRALWVSGVGAGVLRYDPATALWRSYETPGATSGVAFDGARALVGTREGAWWASPSGALEQVTDKPSVVAWHSDGGLYRGAGRELYRWDGEAWAPQPEASTDRGIVAGPGGVWVLRARGAGAGVVPRDRLVQLDGGAALDVFVPWYGATFKTYELIVHPDGAVWASGGGLQRVVPGVSNDTLSSLGGVDLLDTGPDPALVLDDDGAVWVGGAFGLYRWSPQTQALERSELAPPGLVLYDLALAPEGLWARTDRGLVWLHPDGLRWLSPEAALRPSPALMSFNDQVLIGASASMSALDLKGGRVEVAAAPDGLAALSLVADTWWGLGRDGLLMSAEGALRASPLTEGWALAGWGGRLCVGGDGLYCETDGGWEELSASPVRAMAGGAQLWVGLEDGQVCAAEAALRCVDAGLRQVRALLPVEGGVWVGHSRGVDLLSPDGASRSHLDTPPVFALLALDGGLFIGAEQGLLLADRDGEGLGPPRALSLGEGAVTALALTSEAAWATQGGLLWELPLPVKGPR